MKRLLLTVSIVSALTTGFNQDTFAQGKDVNTQATPESTVQDQTASIQNKPEQKKEATELETMVVTAQRVKSLESKTPVAMTALGGEALRNKGITNPTELENYVPNLAVERSNGLQFTIRGVTSSDNTEKGDPSAAFLLDGVYVARPQAQEVSFFDIDRIEVLRGPQGTLYGRNTTAGVIDVITNTPSESLEFAGNATFGNYGAIRDELMVNVPVNDRLAFRAAMAYDRRDNYISAKPGDPYAADPFKDNLAARVSAQYKINDGATLLLRTDYSNLKGVPLPYVTIDRFFRSPDTPDATYNAQNPVYVDLGSKLQLQRSRNQQSQGFERDHTWGFSPQLDWTFGPLTMTYLGSYRQFVRNERATANIPPLPIDTVFTGSYKQNSQELRFATNGESRLQMQFGLYYFREWSGIGFYVLGIPGLPRNILGFPQNPTINKSYAGFAQATYSVTDSLRLTLGARDSHDDKSRVGATVMQQMLDFNPATDLRFQNSAATRSSKITWRTGFEYDLAPASMLYGSVSTGYKAGGFNDGCLAGTTTDSVTCNQARPKELLFYQPETLTAEEIGIKSRLADSNIYLTAAAFNYDYKNLQLSSVVNFNGAPSQTTTNAAKAKVKGLEFDAIWRPGERHRIDVGADYLDAKYANYWPLGVGSAPNYTGRPLDHSPKFVFRAGYTYTQLLQNGARLEAGIRALHSSSYVVSAYDIPAQFRQPSFHKTDLNLSYRFPGDAWYIEAYIKNIENRIVVTYLNSRTDLAPGDPRTFGVRVGFNY